MQNNDYNMLTLTYLHQYFLAKNGLLCLKRSQFAQSISIFIIVNQFSIFLGASEKMSYFLPQSTLILRNYFLNKKNGLSQLFDKIDAFPLFYIPENSIFVSEDNITFGPGHYSIIFSQKKDLFFKIIYYCILYIIFEKRESQASIKIYPKLLDFIFNNDFTLPQGKAVLSQEEIKIYLVKFLYILETSNSRKAVIEELNSIPQINVLFIALIQQISKHKELKFQKNAREIEKNIFYQFQLQFDLLSCELFLFGGEYKVDIRLFETTCEFAINAERPEVIKQIKEEFYLGESAYFKEEKGEHLLGSFMSSLLKKNLSTKILKKQTMQSIEWDDGSEEGETDPFDPKPHTLMRQFQQVLYFVPQKEEAGKQLQKTRDLTLTDTINYTVSVEQPKPLNFYEIINQQNVTSRNALPAPTARSTTFQSQSNKTERGLRGFRPNNARLKFHKTSLNFGNFSHSSSQFIPLGVSKSTQQLRSDGFGVIKQSKPRNDKRVPSFILNKKKKQPMQEQQSLKQLQKCKLIVPKITFTYYNK